MKTQLTCAILTFFVLLTASFSTAQISTVKPDRACINCSSDEPNASAVLEIQASDRGILIPRVASTLSIANPAVGVLIYDNSDNNFKYYNGTIWLEFGGNEQSPEFGYLNDATGASSIALGLYNITSVDADSSSALGFRNEVTGASSSAFGYQNEVTGFRSNAFGYQNETAEIGSSALGFRNEATGASSSAFGYQNEATGNRSSALGFNTISSVHQMTAIGCYNAIAVGDATTWKEDEPVFVVGNGKDPFNRSTALTILKNGNVGIGTTSPNELLEINGKIRLGSAEILEDGGFFTLATNSHFIPTADNEKSLGSSPRRWISVYATNGMINTSDARNKSNIQILDYGLEEIMRLKPVRFEWKGREEQGEKIGLIAQDLLKVLPEVVKTHDWIPEKEGSNQLKKVKVKNLGVYYSDIIPVLIRSIQEQQNQIEAKEEAIEDLREQNTQLEERLTKIEIQLAQINTLYIDKVQLENNTNSSDTPQLQQNQPNPFTEKTLIRYYIPEGSVKSEIRITSLEGKVIKVIPIQATGEGQLTLHAQSLSAGTYLYSLIVDGELIATEKMILTGKN